MEDIEQRDKVLEIFNKWKKTKAVKAYWAFRDKENQDDHHNIESLSPSVISSHSTISLPNSNSSRPADSTTATTAITDSTTSFKTIETTETISLSEAKDLIAPNIELCDNTTIDPQDIPQTLSRSKRYVFDLLNTSLLTFETHLQHLRSLSNVLLIGKHAYHLDLDKHSICDISDIRQSLYDTSGFNKQQSKFPKEIMIKVITIVNSINCESMTRIIGATKVGELLDHIRLPLSLDELPQRIPFLDRLYNVVEIIFKRYYTKSNKRKGHLHNFGNSLESRVLKAITERTVDRTHDNCF